jgi:hypothetical protein
MEAIIYFLLIVHACSGAISLLSGLAAILSRKGGKRHVKVGLVYYWAMLVVVFTGIIIGTYRGNVFILSIAVFSFYMVYTGRRLLSYKKEVKPTSADWWVATLSLLIAFAMLAFGGYILFLKGFVGIAPMLLVFGGILMSMVVGDMRKMWKKLWTREAWLLDHIARMGGSYIATTTAFLVVNIYIQPQWLVWLLPTFVGTPLIVRASIVWRKKLGGNKGLSR